MMIMDDGTRVRTSKIHKNEQVRSSPAHIVSARKLNKYKQYEVSTSTWTKGKKDNAPPSRSAQSTPSANATTAPITTAASHVPLRPPNATAPAPLSRKPPCSPKVTSCGTDAFTHCPPSMSRFIRSA